jgi:hypothetical protein
MGWIVLAVIVALVLLAVLLYNRLVLLRNRVDQAWSGIDVQLKRRYDLIPNLVETVKGYAAHERETLEAVTKARAQASSFPPPPQVLQDAEAFRKFQQHQGELSSALGRLMVVIERYPELKANESFRDLQSQLEGTENRVAVARKRYIDKVAAYNKAVRFFPTNLTAKWLLHAEVKPTFTVPEAFIPQATAKIADLQDPTAKMSKSASTPNGLIELLDDPARTAKKIRSAVTDPGREIIFDREAKPGIANLLTIYSALSGRSIDELTAAYAGKGYGDLKKDLGEVVVEFLRPLQERARGYLDDPAQLDKLLAIGAEKAGAVATATLRTAYDRVGFLPPSRAAHRE